MTLSTKGRYATRIMVAIAAAEGRGPVARQEIADGEGISIDYVGQILMRLKAAGLVRSHRGTRGGFSLAREAAQISVADVVEAAEGSILLAPCDALPGACSRSSECVTRPIWENASAKVRDYLASVTIEQLAACKREKANAGTLDFAI